MELPIDIIGSHVVASLKNEQAYEDIIRLAKACPRIIPWLENKNIISKCDVHGIQWCHVTFILRIDDPLFIERTVRKIKRVFENGKKLKFDIRYKLIFGKLLIDVTCTDVVMFWKSLIKIKHDNSIACSEIIMHGIIPTDATMIIVQTSEFSVILLNYKCYKCVYDNSIYISRFIFKLH